MTEPRHFIPNEGWQRGTVRPAPEEVQLRMEAELMGIGYTPPPRSVPPLDPERIVRANGGYGLFDERAVWDDKPMSFGRGLAFMTAWTLILVAAFFAYGAMA